MKGRLLQLHGHVFERVAIESMQTVLSYRVFIHTPFDLHILLYLHFTNRLLNEMELCTMIR